jgi:Isocitrate dehydrogenase kinase/phosphatase
VTRHGRVVFYDYDELCFITDCNFRDLPQATTPEQEMAAEPWFSVRENDIFPEEFPQFLRLPDTASASLLERHADVFRPEFWRGMQRNFGQRDTRSVSLQSGAATFFKSRVGCRMHSRFDLTNRNGSQAHPRSRYREYFFR